MKTLMFILCLSAALLVAANATGDAPNYTVTAEATRSAEGQFLVSARIAEGTDSKGKLLSQPKLVLNEGQRGQLFVGQEIPLAPAPGDRQQNATTTAPAKVRYVESGIKVEVISVKGRSDMLLVTTVLDKGQITWAASQWIPITPAGGKR